MFWSSRKFLLEHRESAVIFWLRCNMNRCWKIHACVADGIPATDHLHRNVSACGHSHNIDLCISKDVYSSWIRYVKRSEYLELETCCRRGVYTPGKPWEDVRCMYKLIHEENGVHVVHLEYNGYLKFWLGLHRMSHGLIWECLSVRINIWSELRLGRPQHWTINWLSWGQTVNVEWGLRESVTVWSIVKLSYGPRRLIQKWTVIVGSI